MSATNKSKLALEAAISQKFGRLTVVEIAGSITIGKAKRRLVRCICDCGNEKLVPLTYLKRGQVNSCDCLLLETSTANMKIAHNKLYEQGIWEKDPKIASAKKIWQMSYADADISFDQFLILSQNECFYCGAPPANCCSAYCSRDSQFRQENGDFIYNGLDRVDSSKLHSLDNVVPCCIDCNIAKLDRTQKDFFDWIQRVYKKNFEI
jgi:hypothetical protein